MIGTPCENSAFLVLLAALISIPLAIVLGVLGAPARLGRSTTPPRSGCSALAALPEFVVGIALVLAVRDDGLQLAPADGAARPGEAPWKHLNELVLPVATLVLVVVPYIARIMRASMVEVLESDYVEMARLKGLPERVVLLRHALPNAIAPAIQVIALNLAYLAGGIVVVEYVFDYPGIGAKLVDAVHNRDLPVVQTLTILIAAVYVVLNLIADVVTILVSPRVRTSLK